MTTETSRTPFKPCAFLAAFGLALALFPSAANAASVGLIPRLSSATFSAGAADYAYGVSRDGAGNLFIVGATSSAATSRDIWVSRWNEQNLTVISSAALNGSGNGIDFGQSLTIGSSGDIFAMGASSVAGAGMRLWLGKFSPSLTLVSSVTTSFPYPVNFSDGGQIVTGPGGDLYLTSTVIESGLFKVLLARYTPTLAFVSSTSYFNGFDQNYGKSLAFDGSGNIFVAGAFAPSGGASPDIWMGKFTSNLVYLASATMVAGAGGNTDSPQGVAMGSDGNVYVAGFKNNAGGVVDVWLGKYSPGLALLSQNSYPSPSAGNFVGFGLVAGQDRLYVPGYLTRSGQGGVAWLGEFDYSLVMLSSGTFNTASGADQLYGLAVDFDARKAYGVGFVTPASVSQTWLASFKLPGSGNEFMARVVSTAPPSVDPTTQYVPVIYADLIAYPGDVALGSVVTLNLFGDVPSSQFTATLWRDNGDGSFSNASDSFVASTGFSPPSGGLPARASLNTTGEAALTAGVSTRYFFAVNFSSVPPGRDVRFGFELGTDLSNTITDLPLPFYTTPISVLARVHAKPADGNFPTPVGGATRSGGLDTGVYVLTGQRIAAQAAPGSLWNVPASTTADGGSPVEGLGSFNRGALVGRIGSGPWQLLGQSSTITATSNGTLYVAANDANYADNSGFIRAKFSVLPSTTPKIWLGGTLGFETSADINQNWAGGRPFHGESVVFDSGAYNCDWNLPFTSLTSLFVSTAFTGDIRLVPAPYHYNAELVVDGDATIKGGRFFIGGSSITAPNRLRVKGRLTVRDSGTLDAGGGNLELGLGAEVSYGGVLRSAGSLTIQRAIPATPWYMHVDQGSVNVTGYSSFSGIDFLTLASATVVAFDGVSFNTIGTSTSPYIKLVSGAPRSYLFNNLEAGPTSRTSGVSASLMVAGSTVIFNNSTGIGGTLFGSPNTTDPNKVVKWLPDGGGSPGAISGNLSSLPSNTGTFRVIASTSPKAVDNTGFGGGGGDNPTLSGSPAGYSITGLRSPGTYYLFGYINAGGTPGSHSPRGGFGHPGEFRSDPVFLPAGGSLSSMNITLRPWGAVNGWVDNFSTQAGPLVVETWTGVPNVIGSTRQARALPQPSGFFLFETPADFGGVLYSSSVFAFVDANRNGSWDVFEASDTFNPVSVTALSTAGPVNLSPDGGDPLPGGSVVLTGTPVHPGALGVSGPNPLLRLTLATSGGNAEFAALKVRYQGGPLPNPGAAFSVWNDNGDLAFNPAQDAKLGESPIFTLGPSTYTVSFTAPVHLPSGQSRNFFVALELGGFGLGFANAGVLIDAATSFSLSAGTFSVVPGFPIQTGALPILAVVRASETATADLQGGAPTFVNFFPGQMMSVVSTGVWRTGPGDSPTGPGGAPGTTGLNTVLPAANRGELIGRMEQGTSFSSQWFRIGASSTPFASPAGGMLRLAINDFVGAYSDNSGAVLAGFAVSGTSVGALSGQVFYSTPIAGTLTVTARLNGITPMASTSFGVASSSAYPYVITTLTPGPYTLHVTHGSNSNFGLSVQNAYVQAGATTSLDAVMYTSTAGISGTIAYTGVLGQGNFEIGVATVTDFTGLVHFFGGVSTGVVGSYAIGNLPAPATYFLISYRDGNGKDGPDGPEPIGYYGTPGAGVATLGSAMTPIYIPSSGTVPGINVTLTDMGSIEGAVALLPGATGALIVEAGKGVPGTVGYATENRTRVPVPGTLPPLGLSYNLGLLRPATGYSLFAFLDKNFDNQPSAGEEQRFLTPISVPSGGRARVDFALSALSAPPAPSVFAPTAGLGSVTFNWNLVPGATGYQLRSAGGSVLLSLGGGTSVYIDALSDNTSSQIRGITASNGNGVSSTAVSSITYSLATVPFPVNTGAVTSLGATVSWGGTNPAGTNFELLRSSSSAGAAARVAFGPATSFPDALAPASTYFWKVRAVNGNGVATSFGSEVSEVTLPFTGASLAGTLSYDGFQTAGGRNFVIEASTSGTTFFPRASSASLPGAGLQPWFLPVPPSNSYFVRAFVDLAGNGVLQGVADRGSVGPTAVAASPVTGVNFTVIRDTVAPGSPAGALAIPGTNKVTLTWAAPTKNANGSNLLDLAGYVVERSTALSASFFALTPAALSSSTPSFIDFFPIPGIANFYRVRTVDIGGNLSAPSGAVTAVPSSGGSISGQIRTFSAATAGQYRVRLSTMPASSALSVAEAAVTSYTFTALADGVYYLRAFRDINGNGSHDPLTEPAGTFGGLNLPFPIAVVNGNAITGADATICDRSPLQPPAVAGNLLVGSCPALDKGPGFVTNLFALSVGAGTAGSLGVGTQVNLAISTSTAFASEIILLGPDGRVFARDNRAGGANLSTTLSQPGVYLAEPTSFQLGGGGTFQLNMRLEGGFAGAIAGSVTYAGAVSGKVYAQLFDSPGLTAIPIRTSTSTSGFPTPTPFSFAGLPDGTYFLRSYIDANLNGVRDSGEPSGQYGVSASSSLPVMVAGGLAIGAPFTVTLADPAGGTIRGAALYNGTASGALRVETGLPDCSQCSSMSQVVAFATVAAGGVYTLPFLPAATDYVVRAFVDANGNGRSDPLEPTISTFPISVFVNATSTVSLVIGEAGFGAQGAAIVVGTVSYSGTASGPVIMGLSRDSQFRNVDYLLTVSATGYFERPGLLGGTTYYLAGFIDANLNNSPDAALGEPVAAGSLSSYGGAVDFENPPMIFVPVSGVTGVKLNLSDPPNGSMVGTLRYTGTSAAANLIVQAGLDGGFSNAIQQVVPRVVGVSTYSFQLNYLAAGSYYVFAFIDLNGNGYSDFGEPSGGRPSIFISTGATAFPFYGADLDVRDPGGFGATANTGRIKGEMTYLGTQTGPLFVRFFVNPDFLGAPAYTLRVPATPGPGDFDFERANLPFGSYYLDAFRDASDSGVYNPAVHAYGKFQGGAAVSISAQRIDAHVHSSQITDPGMGGSVNAFTGSFAAPGGARFDGGATDLGVIVVVDSTTASGPQPIVLGVSAQNGGVDTLAVRYSSTGVMISSRIVQFGDLTINSLATDGAGAVFIPGRQESTNSENFSATGTLTRYNANWGVVNYAEFPNYQGLDNIGYGGGFVYAAARHSSNQVRALKIDPVTFVTVATGAFASPVSCSNFGCNSRVEGGALSPNGAIFMVYGVVNQMSDEDRGLHFLLKFDSGLNLIASREVTALGAPIGGSGLSLAVTDAGAAYLAFPTDGDTARTFKFDVSGAAITPAGSTAYSPIKVHFSGLGNLQLDPANGYPYEVWESTTGAGDYMLLRYDPSLNLIGQTFFDGLNNTLEDIGFSLSIYNSSTVFMTGSVNNGRNLDWATIRVNGNASASVSAPGAVVTITTANAVNFIAGTVTYGGTLVTSGTVRMSLTPAYSEVPIRFATGTFAASTPFLFNNVPDGLYDIRAFIDPNGNLSPDQGEPIGATTLAGIEHAAQTGSQTLGAPVQLCDRRQIAFDVDVLHSLTAADCTSPDRPGAPRRLYTFAGTRGQPVTILMKAVGFYDSYLDLYGPDGTWLEYDDESGGVGNAKITNYILPVDGVYTIDAGAYAASTYGQFRLSLSASAGALGGIMGRVNYTGSQGGAVIVGLFDTTVFSTATAVGKLVLTSTRVFSFTDLLVGTTYYLGAFIDVNANNAPDQGEDGGVFGLDGVPNPILLASGQVASGIEIAVNPSTAGAATISYVTGVSTYAGTRTGALVLEFWSGSDFSGRPIASRVMPTGVGPYDVAVPGGVPYYVRAYIDANGDFAPQPDEPRGVYAPHGQGAEPVFVPVGQTLVGIDLTLKDPGLTAGGAIAGAGTAVLSSTYAVAGARATLIVTYTAGASGLAGGAASTGGVVGFTAPPGFPFPVASAAGSSVTVKSAFTTFGAVSYNGPSAFVKLTGAGLAAGQTMTLEWSGIYIPCLVGKATVTVSALQNSVAASDTPLPLVLGSPSLAIAAGAARFVQLDEPYFSVKKGELSPARRLETRDQCGTRVALTSALTVDLRTRRYDGANFVFDTAVGVTTNTALSTGTEVAVNFAVGESSKTFYVLAESTGFKNLELHYNLAFDTTFYFGVTAMPADALTAVSVSTASSGVALSSAAIGLAANGQPNSVFLNFTLGDAQQPWHVLVSSLPFKSGESPNAVWERWGYGQPNKGEISWDGRYSPWINGGVRVPNGLYYTRVEVGGGGGVKDDTIRLTVSLPQFAGRAYDPGTVPNPPLSGVQLRMYGPSGYFTAETASDGTYVLPGLGAGSYRLSLSRTDYVEGSLDMTLNTSGAATSFTSRTQGLGVSSNATGGLDLFIGRAPRLSVVPSLDASVAAVANDQWGNLQVRSSTDSQGGSTFYGPMRLKGGTTTFDDGGQWDSATQQFVAKTLLGFNVPVGTYTVLADLTGYSRSTASVYVGPDGIRLDLTPFLPKAVITGQVGLGVGNPAGPNGLPVGLSAVALSTDIVTSSLSGGTYIQPGSTYAVYSISGFDAGAYLLRANTQGLSAVTTGPILVVGTAAVAGVNFPNFGAGSSITGTISVTAQNGTRIFVNAWSPGSFNFGSTVVYVNANAASYALNGLDAGATYQLYVNIEANKSYDVDGGFPRKVLPPATDSFTLKTASGVISGTIILRAGSTDFLNVTLTGVVTASLHPDEVGHSFVEVSTTLPNFRCGDGSAVLATGCCPVGVSSATFSAQDLNTQTLDLRFLHSTTGQSSRHSVSAVNGATVTLVSDLSHSTYSISGFLINQIGDALFNTNAKIVANAPYIKPAGYPVGLSSSTARITAVRQEIDSFGTAISTVFNPISSRVGFLNDSGAFTIPNLPNGVYVVRTVDLRSCSTCAVVVPSVGRLVTVSGASVSSVTLTVSNGYSVSGTISLDGGMLDARIFELSVRNRRQEVVRSTVAYLGDVALGAMAGSVDYSFTNLPAGEFYTLTVRGQLFPIKYAGRPIKFPDPSLSPTGLQSNLTKQNVLMQRAAYLTGRLKDGKTGELILAANATLLAPNFAITASANPWTEGGFVAAASSISNRPIEGDGYFRVGPLVPDVSYDLRLAQTTWDPNFLASGSQNYSPVTIGGLKPTPGEIRDVGIVALGQGQSITGVVKSTATGLQLGNIKVTARPSFGSEDALVVQTFTNSQGVYSLWVSTSISNQFNLVAAPRDGNQASDGRYYGSVEVTNLNLQTQTSANFLLTPLPVVVTGQVLVADAATGGALSYPFGDKRGFPAAALNLQPVGVVAENPLGDIETATESGGLFSIPGLSTGLYNLHATSLGYAVYKATVEVIGSTFHIFTGSNTASNDLPGGVLTLARGATATGRILKSDGTSPNSTEVVGIAAANFAADEFVVGSVETDPVAKTVNAYTISGFKPGISYDLVLLSGSNGKEISFPSEGAGVVFTASESTTTKTINLTYRPARLDCLGTAKALDAARTRFLVQVDCLKPLRQLNAGDDDLTTILTVSTYTSAGAALTAPNGAGTLRDPSNSSSRRLLTATYTVATNETRFSIRIRAYASELDPNTGDYFAIDKVFDFYTGLESSADGRASNINGGKVGMKPSAQDEELGLDERSGIDLPPGAFAEGSDSLPDSSVVANPTTTVNVSMAKGRDQAQAKALSVARLGYAPAALSVADVPSSYPAEMWAAMSTYRTAASTTQVGGANPISAFYSIFLPAGIRHQLKERADLTLSYSLATSTGTTDDKIQVWFYNAVLGRFVPETTNRRLNTVNKTITVSVDHFSTFVVLDSTPAATSTVSFGGADIAVANFPNPADCITHSNIARNATLFGSGGVHAPFVGTMFRASIPLTGTPADLRYNIYNVAGEKVRTIEQGVVPVGQTYYTPWNCANDRGETVSSGVYIGEVIHGGRSKFFKIAIIKGSGL